MSTYTDTKNRIKETVNVTYHPGFPDDRVSTQKVKFLNEENEYWGTFKGKSVLEDAEISGSVIKDTIIKDVTLSGEVRLPGGVDINAVGQELENIKQDIEDIQLKDNKQDINIEQLNEKADNISVDLTNKLTEVVADVTGVKTYVDERISAVNDKIDTDISELSTQLSDELSQTKTELSTSIVTVKTELSNAIVAETTERIANDAIIKTKVFDLSNNLELSTSELISKIERDKHYEIITVDSNSYPYEIKDFAVNQLYLDIPHAKVIYNEQTIGSVTKNEDGSINFTVYKLSDPNLYEALTEGMVYTLGTESVPGKAGYLIKYDSDNSKINITSTVKKSLNVIDTNTEIPLYVGKVTTFSPDLDTTVDDVESGSLTIYPTSDSNYKVFYCQDVAFNKTDASCITINNNQIIYIGNNRFVFKKGVYETSYSKIIQETIDPDNNVELGRIYNGNLQLDDNGAVKAITAVISSDEYEISKPNMYGSVDTIFGEQLKDHGKLAVYSTQTSVIQIYDDIQYSYKLKAADDSCVFKPLTKNVHLYNYSEYDEISAEIHFGGAQDRQLGFVLTSEDNVIWTSNTQFDDLSVSLVATFDTTINTLSTIVTKRGDHGTEVVNSTYIFDPNHNVPEEVEELYSYNIEHTSQPIVFDFNYTIDVAESTFEANINPIVVIPSIVKTFQLAIEDDSVNTIDIKIPAKNQNLSSVNSAREFIFTANLGPKDLDRYIEVKANYKITNGIEDTLSIHLDGLKHVYQFTEVANDTFLYVDLTHHDLSSRVKNLEDNLAEEIATRISVDTEISTQLINLSNETSAISTAISTEIDNLSVALSGEIDTLSNKLSTEINHLSDSLSTEIDNLSVALSGEIDTLSTSLSGEIDTLSTKLSSEIDTLSTSLSGEVDVLSTSLSGEIDALSTSLSGEIDVLSTSLSGEIDTLSTKLSTEIEALSTSLSGEIDLLSTSLSTAVDLISSELSTTTSSQIFEISTQLYKEISTNILNISILSTDLETVSADLHQTISDLNVVSADLYETISDLTVVSSDLHQNISDLIDLSTNYHNTLSGIDRENEQYADILTDNLLITDPEQKHDTVAHTLYHDKYYMTFLSGTLVLKKVAR